MMYPHTIIPLIWWEQLALLAKAMPSNYQISLMRITGIRTPPFFPSSFSSVFLSLFYRQWLMFLCNTSLYLFPCPLLLYLSHFRLIPFTLFLPAHPNILSLSCSFPYCVPRCHGCARRSLTLLTTITHQVRRFKPQAHTPCKANKPITAVLWWHALTVCHL